MFMSYRHNVVIDDYSNVRLVGVLHRLVTVARERQRESQRASERERERERESKRKREREKDRERETLQRSKHPFSTDTHHKVSENM